MSDIGNILKGYGVQLEQKAVNQFGAAVGDYSRQIGLGPLSDIAANSIRNRGLTTGVAGIASALGVNSLDNILGNGNAWQSSRYASDMVAYAPKHRFIFKVKFIFNDPYSEINREFMYVVKEIDKPTVLFEYEEINMYNFKTKVLKSIRHEPLNMVFHDDIQNKVLDFFNAYRVAYSPISSLNYNQQATFEDMGMDFYQPGSGGSNSASMGILQNNNVNILRYIEVTQVYAHGTAQNSFIFTNPRIENFDFDNLTHESSEGNSLAVSFSYDSLYIEAGSVTNGTPAPAWGATDILGNTEQGPRNNFGNQLMGGDFGSKVSFNGLSSFTDTLGKPISAITSAFGSVQAGLRNAISSGKSELSTLVNSTLSKALPRINQSSAGVRMNDIQLENIDEDALERAAGSA